MFGTFYHLYPHVKRPRWIIVFAIGVIFYISMGIIEFTRNYGSGLDIDKLEYLEGDQIREGATEGMGVFEFSADVMEVYQPEDFIHFEPVVNALLLPFPRQIFKNKPKGYYMREANIKVYGDITKGAAFLNFTEAYISFGWLGIILYGLLFGLFAKIIWVNYLRHPSLGAILLLASFNAWIYVFISRGYMAQAYLNYFYYVIIPFWIVWIVDRFTKTDRFNHGIS